MGAICSVGENWFGLLYSWADSKKKSNLMLSIFEPGNLRLLLFIFQPKFYSLLSHKERNAYLGWAIWVCSVHSVKPHYLVASPLSRSSLAKSAVMLKVV